MKKLYTLVLGLALALMWMASAGSAVAHAEPETLPTVSDRSYAEYLGMYGDRGFHGASISLKASAAVADDGQLMQLEGREALVLGDQGYAQWRFPVEKAGLYRLEFDYYSIQGTGGDIERAVYLDGQLPFQESYNINLSRVFRDENPVVVNQHGDDFRPRQEEVHLWQKRAARDQFGYFGEALYYYLSEGEHTLELAALREPVAVHELTLVSQEVTLPTYQEYLAQKTAQGAQPVQGALEDGILVLQAESPYRKSHQSLFAVNDNSSPMTAPYDPAYKRLNAIGGLRWNRVGQWISWQVDVPQDGLYHIGARSKQNVYRDLVSVRSLYIDGGAPFQEALGIEFAFSDNFNVQPFHAGGQPFLVYLTKGVHEITLATSLGSIADILMASSHNLAELNRINLQLIALMGTTPDIDRDYQISTFMPELLEWMERVRQGLTAVRADLLQAVSYSDAMIAQLDLLLFQMERMVKYPDRMAEYFGGFRELIRSFGSWIMQAREKPLLLDYVFISEPGAALPPAEHGFLKNFWYGARAFAASFYTDYTSLSGSDQAGKEKDFITVWIGDGLVGGRDQAVALNRMIKDEFTAITGIPVNLQLVPGGTILTATLAGKGPDIALQLDGTAPVNYAMRNALHDLSSFPDYEEVFSRFPAPAVTPFEYRGGVYAIPRHTAFPCCSIAPTSCGTWAWMWTSCAPGAM